MIGVKLRQPAFSSGSRFTPRFCHEAGKEFRYRILAEGITRKLLFRPTASLIRHIYIHTYTFQTQCYLLNNTHALRTRAPLPSLYPAPSFFILCNSCALVEYLRAAGTCSPKCAVKILDTILPFVLWDLRINLWRLRRAEKNALPYVTHVS